MTSRIQVPEPFPDAQLPTTASLWAEASHWACDAMNRAAMRAIHNPDNKPLDDIVVVVVVVVLTLTHNSMQSVVAGQAPITLEWKKYLK